MAIAYYNSASMEWEVLDMETEEVLDSFEDRFARSSTRISLTPTEGKRHE